MPVTAQKLTYISSQTEQDNEKEILNLAKSGNTAAFKQLFDANVSRIYVLCLRMSGDIQQADELTQDTFVKAWEKLSSFRGESKFSTWLHSIAVNEFLMSKRSSGRMLKKIFTANDLTFHENSSLRHNYIEEIQIDLEKAISRLPKQSKMVFILHDVEGYMHHEIAGMMKIETGTSKAHLHRARKILREELTK